MTNHTIKKTKTRVTQPSITSPIDELCLFATALDGVIESSSHSSSLEVRKHKTTPIARLLLPTLKILASTNPPLSNLSQIQSSFRLILPIWTPRAEMTLTQFVS